MVVAPVPVELIVGGRQLSEPRLAPGGRWLAYVVTDATTAWFAVADLDLDFDLGAAAPVTDHVVEPAPAAGRGLGGGSFDWYPDGRGVVYVAGDGALWSLTFGEVPRRVWASVEGERSGAQAPCISPDGTTVAFMVDQRHIACVPTDGGPATVLTADVGPDFCFDPVFSPDGSVVAFQGWSVPDMPWDGAARFEVAADGSGPPTAAPGSDDHAVQQPGFDVDGRPIEIRDDTGWLNVWVAGRPLLGDGGEPSEHAGPTWGPRQRTWAASPDGGRVAFSRNERGFGRVCIADVATGAVAELGRGVHGQLSWQGTRLAALRTGARTPTEVVVHELDGDTPTRRLVATSSARGWADHRDVMVEPTLVTATALDGATLHARRYASPAPAGRLLVWVHGGPTSQWDVAFMPGVPFWLSRGWDVLLVDPRGSTGHGRDYQQALRGGWGRLDTDDVAVLTRHAHDSGWGEPSRTVVMGGSSGGLTVLGVLGLHPGTVAGGVALYPVSDIADLSVRSHRFELHYNDTLIGPDSPARSATFATRSPLTYAGSIEGPLLVLHGTVDPVIMVDQSIELAASIRRAGGEVELHLLDGEGHGFRRAESKAVEYRLVERFLDRVVPE